MIQPLVRRIKEEKYFWFITILFLFIYSAISLVNHYNFRTYALDLGAYTNALYDYIHFQWNDSMVFKEIPENLLADHFDLYLILFSPFVYLFGTYTLLVLQILFFGVGGLGIFRLFRGINNKLAIPATINFYLFFGIFSAVSFDYHSNVVASMLIPWLFISIRKKNFTNALILLVAILVAKENLAPWLLFICLGLFFDYRKDRKTLTYLALFSLISIAYYFSVTKFVMPAISNNGVYPHFNYSVLGTSETGAISGIFSHPVDCIKAFFMNHMHHPQGDYVKAELHILLIVSGLVFLLFKPNYLFMLIPVYFQKLFNDNFQMWGINGQYSIEYAPIITIGAFMVISKLKKQKFIHLFSGILILGTLASTVRMMDHTEMYTKKSKIRFYQASHYIKEYNVDSVYTILKMIPENAAVSAHSPFLPHLALRENIYQFPVIKDASYIVFSDKEEPYPLSGEEFKKLTNELCTGNGWAILAKRNGITLLKRK